MTLVQVSAARNGRPKYVRKRPAKLITCKRSYHTHSMPPLLGHSLTYLQQDQVVNLGEPVAKEVDVEHDTREVVL